MNESFPNSQFRVDGYYSPGQFRRDRNEHGGGLMLFVKQGIPAKRIKTLESEDIEVSCLEVNIAKRKWAIFNIYRPSCKSIDLFFNELTKLIDLAINKYENIVVMGDFNIDISDSNSHGYQRLEQFSDIFSLQHLIKSKTCITKTSESTTDLILTNRSHCFQFSKCAETGMSDFHRMTFTVFRSQFTRQKPIKIQYRDYSRFDADKFLRQLNDEIYKTSAVSEDCPDVAYNTFAEKFCNIINKHAPLKNKTLRGNQAPFMNKELAKAITTRSRLKNTFIKDNNKQNWQAFAKQRNKCTKLRKKAIKSHFAKVTGKGTMTNQCFWKTVKPFLNRKGNHGQQTIILEENDKIHENPTVS